MTVTYLWHSAISWPHMQSPGLKNISNHNVRLSGEEDLLVSSRINRLEINTPTVKRTGSNLRTRS